MIEPTALPDMTIPFPGVCHPEIDRIESEAMAWVSRYATDEAMRELEKTRAGRIVARTAGPTAPGELVRAYGKMLAWGFWFDDRFIDDTRADSPDSVPAISSVLSILDTGRRTGAAGSSMEAAFAEVVDDLRQILAPAQFVQWQIEMRQWFASMCMQNVLRVRDGVPRVDTYKIIRLYTVCTFPCVVLLDASGPVDVGWSDYHRRELSGLRQRAANVVAWQNDIFSFFAEQRHPGRFWNLPALYSAQGDSVTESIERTARDVAAEIEAFLSAETRLEAVTPGQDAHLRSLRQWMRGCRDWSLEAAQRYFGWLR